MDAREQYLTQFAARPWAGQLEPKAEHITGVQEQEQGQAEVKLFASQQLVEVSMKLKFSQYSERMQGLMKVKWN